jgi:hypothetical protein
MYVWYVCMYSRASLNPDASSFGGFFYLSLLQSYASSCYYFNILYISANRRGGEVIFLNTCSLHCSFFCIPQIPGEGVFYPHPTPFPRSPLDLCRHFIVRLICTFLLKRSWTPFTFRADCTSSFHILDLAAIINGKVNKPYDNYQDHTVSKDKVNKSYKNQDF